MSAFQAWKEAGKPGENTQNGAGEDDIKSHRARANVD